MEERRKVEKVLVGKLEGKRSLENPISRWEDETRRDRGEIGCGGGDWIKLAQNRESWQALVNAVINFPVLAPQS
jgi:hypothetical protein